MGQVFFSVSLFMLMIVIINYGVSSGGHVRTHDSIFMDSEIDYDSYDEPLSRDDHEEDVEDEAANSDYCKEEQVLQKELFCNYRADEKIQTRLLQSLDPCLCTHLVYSSISEMNTVQNLNADNFKKVFMLKTKNKNLKILFDMQISELLLKDDMNVTKAMEELMDVLTDFVSNGFLDGISLNFNLTNNFTNPKQALNFVFILIEFFRYVSEVSDKPNLLLTINLPQNYTVLFDEDAISYLNQFIDYFILPTFRPTHLERLTNEGLFEFSPDMSKTESIVHSLLQTGVSKSKLIISIPIFGMAYVVNNSTDVNGMSRNREKRLSYPQVCSIISSAHWNTTNTNGCCSTYVTNNIFWITYSNQINVQAEVTYTILRRLGGVSLSAINDDDYRGVCRIGNFPLLSKANDVLRKKDVEVVRDANDLLIHEESRLLKVFTPLTSEDTSPYNCKRNGYYRDRSNCTRFYQCAKQMPIGAKSRFAIFLFECPFGLAFDEEFQICNFQLWSQSCDASNEISPVPSSMFHCSSPGYHKDPEHCKWFYYCSSFGGDVLRAYEFRCPTSDLAFDAEKLLCNWRHLVPGCGEGETPIYTPHKHLNAHTETVRVAKSFKINYDTDSYASIRPAHGNQQEEWRRAKKLDIPNLEVTQRRKISESDVTERDDNIDPYASITSRYSNQQKEERGEWRFDAPILKVTQRRKQLSDNEDKDEQNDKQEDFRNHDKIPGVLYITDVNKEIPVFTGDEGINNTPYLNNEYQQQHMPRIRQDANDQIINNGNVQRNQINPYTSVIRALGYQQQTARKFEPYDLEITERRKPTAVNEEKDQDDMQLKYMNDQEIPGVLYVTDVHSKNSNIFHGNEEINNTPQLRDEHQKLSRFRQNSSLHNKAGNNINDSKQRSIDWLRFVDIPHNKNNTNTPRSYTGLKKIDKSNEARVQCSKMETYQAQANNIADKIQNEYPLGCVSEISVNINMPKNTSGVQSVMKRRTPHDRNRAYGRSLGINSEELLDPSTPEIFEDDNKVFIKTRSTANYNNPIILLVKATSNINPSEKSKDMFSGQQSVTRPYANFERSSKKLTRVTGHITSEIDENFPERVNSSMFSFDNTKTVSNDNSNSKLQTTTYDSFNLQQNSQPLKDKLNIKPNTRDSISNGPKFIRREPSMEGETEFFENAKQTTGRYMNNKNEVNFSGRSVSAENSRQSSEGLLLDVDINGRQQMHPGVLYVVEMKRWQKQPIPHVEYLSLKDDINSNLNTGKKESAHVSTLPNANNKEVSKVYISSTVSPNASNREANQAYFSSTAPVNTQRRASQVQFSSTPDTSREEIQVHSSSTPSPNANKDANREKMLSTRADSKIDDFSQSHSTGGLSSVTNSKDVMTNLEQDYQSTTKEESEQSGNAKPTTQTLQNNDFQGRTGDTSPQTNSEINRISKALDNHLEHEQVDQNMPQNHTLTKERLTGINPFRNRFTSLRQQLLNQNQNSDFVIASHHNSHNRQNHNSRILIRPMQTHNAKPAFGARVTHPKSNIDDKINTRNNLDNDRNTALNLELNHGVISKKNDTVLGEINRIKEELRTLRHSPITTNRPSINTTRTIAEKNPRTSRQHFPQFNSEFLPRQWLILPLNPRTEDPTNAGNSRMPKHIDLPTDRREDIHDKQGTRYANNSTSNSQIYTQVRREQKHNALFRWNVAFLNDKKHISTPNVVCTSEGLFFDPDDCSKFYECYWDQWLEKFTIHMFSCPVTLVFDERISGCVYQDDQAPCIRS